MKYNYHNPWRKNRSKIPKPYSHKFNSKWYFKAIKGVKARLNNLILQIMEEVFTYHARNGKFRGAWQPWSRHSAGALVLLALSETEPIGESLAVKAKDFLLKHNVIVDEQLNLAQYSDLAAIQKLLYAPVLLPLTNTSALKMRVAK